MPSFAWLVVQLGLALTATYLFRIQEEFGFTRILPLLFCGFVAHALLPERWRGPFRAVLFLAAAGLLYGLQSTLIILGVGLALFGLCHLPVRFRYRLILLTVAGVTLALCRAGRLFWPAGPSVLPILASMFMFRIILYLYEHRIDPGLRVPFWRRLGYFFMLPNICFPFFPVVDYRNYIETYYNEEPLQIYKKGVSWIVLGFSHLLIYRFVYFYWMPVPSEVNSGAGFLSYMITAYLLYLRISGQFHLIVGILALFGHNLPATHRHFFFAADLADYWRRVNIYWTDFMTKLFYYPALLRFRQKGPVLACMIAITWVFFMTCLLHAYQWFWLRGYFSLTDADALFWGSLGAGMVVQAMWRATRSSRRTRASGVWGVREAALWAFGATAMFFGLSLLWSVWSSGSLREWLSVVDHAHIRSGDWVYFAALFTFSALVLAVGRLLARRKRPSLGPTAKAILSTFFCTGLILSALLQTHGAAGPSLTSIISVLREDGLSRADEDLHQQGYYNKILESGAPTTRFWEGSVLKPSYWPNIKDTEFAVPVNGVREFDLAPSKQGLFHGAFFETNEWGMRDRPCSRSKPSGIYRVAFLGSSFVMGSGVGNEEDFESLIERRLNRDCRSPGGRGFEVLNFGVGTYILLRQLPQFEEKAAFFEPDVAFFVIHEGDYGASNRRPDNSFTAPPARSEYAFIRRIENHMGLRSQMGAEETAIRMARFRQNILKWEFHRIAKVSRRAGIRAGVIFLPTTKGVLSDKDRAKRRALAREFEVLSGRAGLPFWSLEGIFDGYKKQSIEVAPWDPHLNKLGHQLVARGLYAFLVKNAPSLGFKVVRKPESDHARNSHD